MAQYDYRIGTTQSGMTNVEDLPVSLPPPRSAFVTGLKRVTLGNGLIRELGLPSATWYWDYLTREQRDQLRQFCDSASATVYIRTRLYDGDNYKDYQAVMVWPEDEERESGGRRLSFAIEFKRLVEV